MRSLSYLLKRISRALARVPSLGYAIAYLLCIPVFGILFWSVSDSFYHSTVQFEKHLDEDADNIIEELGQVIKEQFKGVHGDYTAFEGDWVLWISELQLSALKTTDTSTEFSIRLRFSGKGSKDGMETHMPLRVIVDNTGFFVTQDTTTKKWIHYKEVRSENQQQLPVSLRFIFPQNEKQNGVEFPNTVPLLSLPEETNRKIIAFHNSTEGFPSQATGTLGRMLYLSSVTITTLGYGDIVPISGLSRFLVGLESVIGIVLIGLFLNSLSRENQDT